MKRWTMHHGECLAGLVTLDDLSVDVTITDPPYDQHTHTKSRRGVSDEKRFKDRGGQSAMNRVRALGFDAITRDQQLELTRQVERVSKRWALIFCAVEMIHDWRSAGEAAGLEYIRTCFWHKLGSTPQFTGDRPAIAVEAIVVLHRPGRKRWNGGGKHGWYEHAELVARDAELEGRFSDAALIRAEIPEPCQVIYHHPIVLDRGGHANRVHTTQKPLSLMRELVEDFSDPDDLVLDPFAGSGTTGLAAVGLGRRFVGWELNIEYHAIATRRLSGEEAKPRIEQPSLNFGAP